MPQVSVIIPAYNAEAFLADAIASALAQTLKHIEVIVVDDGSTDGTLRIAQSFGDDVRVLTGPNCGLPAARNKGARAARGEWLAFLDADDLWSPIKLERQLALTGDAVHFVYTERRNIGNRGSLPERQSDGQAMCDGDVFEALLVNGNVITASSVLISREIFWSLGGFSEDLVAVEDWDLWIRVAERHTIRYCAEPLVSYRFHAGMMSGDPLRMQRARAVVVHRALALPRADTLDRDTRRRMWASMWSANGWDAARRGHHLHAAASFLRAILWQPFLVHPYRELAKLALGRT